MRFYSIFCAVALAAIPAAVAETTSNPELVAQLKMAATQLDRNDLLPNDDDWIHDFNADPKWNINSPGSVVNANAATFPAVVGHGMTMAILNLGPCSMLPPHYHPRASNFVVAVSGETHTYMVTENGARVVETTLTAGKMTIFPRGSLHAMENLGCTPAQLVSALNDEDQGTQNMVNSLMGLPQRILDPATGYSGVDYDKLRGDMPEVGTGSIYGNKECIERCQAQRRFRS